MRIIGLIMIGGMEKHCGKTTFSTFLINRIKSQISKPVFAIKATIIHDKEKLNSFAIQEETNPDIEKDTSRLLKAGAKKVYWLKSDEKSFLDGFETILKKIGNNALVLCESNKARKFIEPDLYIMIKRKNSFEIKHSAKEVLEFADFIVESEFINNKIIYSPNLHEKIQIVDNLWKIG